eukprot:CAMPEP_0183750792 /NCGR_PEP_ID=MMETSP0739-20130205/1321_1 /TAXON_ID=385413 /ORGANISM="Thalassiosira miniscula, Strain CCMP1093" /LENGTH=554 /DNA_ID=CAMNT_0025986911 /DNA_START=59 /DNA_END=1723 /DNA_ORIENTATION=-
MMVLIRPSPLAISQGVRRLNPVTSTATTFCDARLLSSAPSNSRRSKTENDRAQQQQQIANNNIDANAEPWWSLSSLHKRVATVIATSLPDESLSAVYKSLSEKLNDAESHKSVSINEAIVSARAREASAKSNNNNLNNSQSNERLKEIEKDIEQRALQKAQERMQLELQAMEAQWKRKEEERIQREREERERLETEHQRELAFERWKDNAEKERQKEEQNQLLVDDVLNEANGDLNINMDEIASNQQEQQQLHRDHPILGPQIAQLPYKRIHLTSASTLASLPVYEKQRAYRHDRAQVMAKDKKKTLWMGIPGVISLMEEDDGRLSILDGQHRVGMMSLLEEEQRKLRENNNNNKGGIANNSNKSSNNNEDLAKLDLDNILVEVFFPRQSDNRDDADSVLASGRKQVEQDDKAAIFTEINKAEPIKLLDLPGMATKRTRDIIDHAASHFHDAYPAMFSTSQKCRAPHLNLDNLREALFASEVIKREKIGSGGELVKWIVKKNEALMVRYGDENGDGDDVSAVELENDKRVSETALRKARKHDFYLGLESTWLYK